MKAFGYTQAGPIEGTGADDFVGIHVHTVDVHHR